MSRGGLQIRLHLPREDFALSVDLQLPGQGISMLFGPSGSGKTTVLRCVAGLERSAQGRVSLDDLVWQDDETGVLLPVWQRRIGYVFQEASLFEHLDVRRNLAYGLRRSGQPGGAAVLDEAISLLGIGHLMQRQVGQLSGGERQRVAVARALATQPRLLLLDEPMAALDLARRQEILPWLEKLRDELSIPMLYVTHSADEVARLADHLVVMADGRVRAAGPVTEVLASVATPVVVGEDAGVLIEARIVERDEAWHLARAEFAGGSLWVTDRGLALGQGLRLRVLARDVSLQRDVPARTSVQNRLPVRIDSMVACGDPSQLLVRLRCGESVLLARVTRRAANELALVPGMELWALVKALAILG